MNLPQKLLSLLTMIVLCLAIPAFAQKGTGKKMQKQKIDPVLPVIERAEKALAEGHPEEARKAYEEAFRLDTYHRHDAANIGLASFLLDDRLKQGEHYDLTKDQIAQRFQEVPYLAQGFCQFHLGDTEGAKRAWHNIIEWRGSDELVVYLHELKLDTEVGGLKSEMGIDSGTGIAAQKALEEKYKMENKWEGAFQIVRKQLLEIPVGSKAELGQQSEALTQTCIDYFFKQNDPKAGLRKMAGELYQRTEDHERILGQILTTKQVAKTSLVRVHPIAEAEAILKKRIDSLAELAGYLDTLSGHPDAPVAAGAVEAEPPESPPAPKPVQPVAP